MATEQPAMPDLKGLRLAYATAIAATESAQMAIADELDPADPVDPGLLGSAYLVELQGMRDAARRAELEAGRAFLAALQEADPACVSCGCLHYDPCIDEDGDTCGWASMSPPTCTFCAQRAEGEAT